MKKLTLLFFSLTIALSGMAQTLVAHYDFSSTTSTPTTAFESINSLNGAATNCTAAAGKCGTSNTAFSFNGSTSFITTATNTTLNLSKWTIQAVVYVNAFNTTSLCQVSKILQHGSQYSNDYYALEINDNNDDPSNPYGAALNNCYDPVDVNSMRFYGAAAGSISPVSIPSSTVTTGQWYCLTATYDGSTMNYYVDGVLNYSRSWPSAYAYSQALALLIGKGTGSGGTTYWFDGLMDDLLIYDDAMSASQVGGICTNYCSIADIGFCSALSTPFQYSFTPNVVSAPGSTVTWDFGDGTPVTTPAPAAAITHTYPFSGTTSTYTVTMTVYDPCGNPCTSSVFDMCLSLDGARQPGGSTGPRQKTTACVINDIGYCGSTASPFQYLFNPLIVGALPGSTMVWNFGGVTTPPFPAGPPTPPVSYTFPGSGSYTITLTVTEPGGTTCQQSFVMCLSNTGAKSSGSTSTANITYEHGIGNPYPNPATAALSIPVSGLSGTVSLTVIAMDGRTALQKELPVSAATSKVEIGTEHLAPGTYMLQINSGTEKVFRRFSKL